MTNTPSYRPICPNHNCPLGFVPFPLPKKGEGRCPISGVIFTFEAEVNEQGMKLDKFGVPMKDIKWKVEGND